MSMYKAYHLRDDIDRLYVTRKEGGRGLESIDDCVDGTVQGLKEFINSRKERLVTATSNRNKN